MMLWSVSRADHAVGHVTRCAYSPRLERNIGFVNVPIEHSANGTALTIDTGRETVGATVVPIPWFESVTALPVD
jgi:glycine cleavage system aminomethyltransferase T